MSKDIRTQMSKDIPDQVSKDTQSPHVPRRAHRVNREIRCSHPRKLRDPEYNSELAAYLTELNLSGEQTVLWVLDQLYETHTGRLRNGLDYTDDKPERLMAKRGIEAFNQGRQQRRSS
ncbi:MAG: hypothetical protein AAGF28_12610 [Pseudomonadota bacterium]